MSNTKLPCIFTDNKLVNNLLNSVIGSVFKDKNEQTSVINLLCNLSRYSSVCKLGGADCVQLRKDMFNEILSMGGPISKEIDSEIDLSKLIPGMNTYVNDANTFINIYNNMLQKGDMVTEDVIGIINKYISILNNITSYLPLGQNKLAAINTINIDTIASDCKDAQNTILENQKTIDQLNTQLQNITKDFSAYKNSHPNECKPNDCSTCPVKDCPVKDCPVKDCPVKDCPVKDCPACQACPDIKCLDVSTDVSTDCSNKLSDLNYQMDNLKATKDQMDIVGIIIVSILALLLLWLIWTFLIEKKKLV